MSLLLILVSASGSSVVTAQSADYSRLVFVPMAAEDIGNITLRQPPPESGSDTAVLTPDDSLLDSIDRYRRGINDSIENGDSYSALIREQYFSLGQAQQAVGEHVQAIASFEQAMQIDRVNEGLFTLSQQDLVEAIIESHNSLGNFREAADYREYLYLVQSRSYADDDPRLLAAKEDWADWNIRSYLSDKARSPQSVTISTNAGVDNDTDYVAIYNPRLGSTLYVPRNQLPNILNPLSGPGAAGDIYQRSMTYAVSPESIVDQRLRRAETLYEEILDPDRAGPPSTREATLRDKLGAIAFAKKVQMDAIDDNSDMAFPGTVGLGMRRSSNPVVTRGYIETRDRLQEAVAALEDDPDTQPLELAEALIKLADWELAYDRSQRGFDTYAKAWSLLESAGLSVVQLQATLNPQVLVPIPSLAIHPYSRASAGYSDDFPLDYKGYIDLTLSVDRYGRVRRRNVEGVSDETPQIIRRKLMDYLEDQKMRPLISDGSATARNDLKIRYYYSY